VTKAAVAAGAASAALAAALLLTTADHGRAAAAYVLFLGATGLLVLVSRTRGAARTRPLEQLVPRAEGRVESVGQLEALTRRLAVGEDSAVELHHRLRPLVRQIAGVQLERRHGVDLDRSPERAGELLGPRTWELVRPDRAPPADRFARGWPPHALQELVDELEAI
jgi:hypothetical protein